MLERGRTRVRDPRRNHNWDEYIDGFDSVMVREDEDTDEYYELQPTRSANAITTLLPNSICICAVTICILFLSR
ncbi:hypothetical protein FRB97_007841 [Tulasnella sp. 331]|nr:hypothetical protein FRB97_007841 [Tulasnella sp. 331]